MAGKGRRTPFGPLGLNFQPDQEVKVRVRVEPEPQGPRRDPDGNEREVLRILELLESGAITPDEADELIAALSGRAVPGPSTGDAPPGAPDGERPRWFRVRVTDARSGAVHANVTLPLALLNFGIGIARRWHVGHVATVDRIVEAAARGQRGTIVDIVGDNGERVEIFFE